jgi:hypothetical protein
VCSFSQAPPRGPEASRSQSNTVVHVAKDVASSIDRNEQSTQPMTIDGVPESDLNRVVRQIVPL